MKLHHIASLLLNQDKQNKGFSLIELLVVIIIIGILSAIALPSFLNQANKAKQSEAKTYIGSMNRAQQAYYIEKSELTTRLELLGLGINPVTDNYFYFLNSTDIQGHVIHVAYQTSDGMPCGASSTPDCCISILTDEQMTISCSPFLTAMTTNLNSYVGGVGVMKIPSTDEWSTLAAMCERSNGDPVTSLPPSPGVNCPEGFEPL